MRDHDYYKCRDCRLPRTVFGVWCYMVLISILVSVIFSVGFALLAGLLVSAARP